MSINTYLDSIVILVNKRSPDFKPGSCDVYIGRGSSLGNPAAWQKNTKGSVLVKDRAAAIEYYDKWLQERLRLEDKDIRAELNKIYSLAISGGVRLVCYCVPDDCHGRIIKAVVVKKILERIESKQLTLEY